jgi:hypothetical protein
VLHHQQSYQYLEHTKIIKTLTPCIIVGYFCYVDDVLMVYDKTVTDIHRSVQRSMNWPKK